MLLVGIIGSDVLAVAVALFALKGNRKALKTMCLMLTCLMLFTMVPMGAFAADEQAFSVERTVTVGNKAYTIGATVRYAIGEEVEDEYYTVTFDLNYEGAPELETQQVKTGELVEMPEDPKREGYAFVGWYEDKNPKEFTKDYANETIFKDVVLYAYWLSEKDTDGDHLIDGLEIIYNTDISKTDTDDDGLSDYIEVIILETDPLKKNDKTADSDGDGISDIEEVKRGTDPGDSDTDADQLTDADEETYNTDPLNCDTDGDGVYDYEDQCPTIAGVKENLGCPEIKREIRNLLKKAMSGIQFENAKATIKPNSYKILNDIAKIFIDNPTYIVEVQGHTDNVGKYDYNMDLSERRAQAVRTYLINQGVPAERLSAHGYGPDRPIDDNKTKAGRAKNRRVEFNITFEEVTYETVYDRVQNSNNQQ